MKAFIVEPSEIRVGGVSLRERQERMLRQAGIAEILRAPHEVPPDPPKEEVLVLAGNMLIDPRIVHALVDQNGNVMAIDSRSNGAWVGASRNDYFHLNRDNEPALLDIATLDDYVPKLRRHIPIYWLTLCNRVFIARFSAHFSRGP
ncbi:hypothetical protein HY230_06935 [Candidatus Acetothermia bacterium]|nr:hypothetical protein [Candidatus Acetothermia bacterium]